MTDDVQGRLSFRTRPVNGHPIEHTGLARLLRIEDGRLIFDLDMDGTPEIALYPDELLAFVRPGAEHVLLHP